MAGPVQLYLQDKDSGFTYIITLTDTGYAPSVLLDMQAAGYFDSSSLSGLGNFWSWLSGAVDWIDKNGKKIGQVVKAVGQVAAWLQSKGGAICVRDCGVVYLMSQQGEAVVTTPTTEAACAASKRNILPASSVPVWSSPCGAAASPGPYYPSAPPQGPGGTVALPQWLLPVAIGGAGLLLLVMVMNGGSK